MVPQQDGYWFHSKTAYGDLFHAELFPGKENSGKLVTLVKQKARLWMEDNKLDLSIIDGPPGIGCPVISACAGADLGMVVSEPGLSGLIDLERILATLRHFHVPSVICINKADLYQEGTQQIRTYAAEQGIEILGEVPFDDHISQAISQGVPVSVLNSESPASKSIQLIWKKILGMLFPTGDVS
jgi:MinD superfamily P-loop ATPase